jgi:site-specific DNA recombinase
LLQVQGMIAEYERAKILERSRRGKRHAAQVGRLTRPLVCSLRLPLRHQTGWGGGSPLRDGPG